MIQRKSMRQLCQITNEMFVTYSSNIYIRVNDIYMDNCAEIMVLSDMTICVT